MTSIDALSKYDCYSADSISHRLIAGYCKILVPEFGVISISKRTRTSKTKSNLSFVETCDAYNLKKLNDYIESLGFTLEQAQESSSCRVVITMRAIQEMTSGKYALSEKNLVKPKKLFNF